MAHVAAGDKESKAIDLGDGMILGRTMKLEVEPFFSKEGEDPYSTVEWEKRTASITNANGEVFFEQKDIEAPTSWSQMATNIVASKYFNGRLGTEKRETSVRQLISRVVDTITNWGLKDNYFNSETEAKIFNNELTHLLLHQKASFNSPVWFNCGIKTKPQCSACFINSVDDSMESIMRLATDEAMIFKGGSGAGVNLSPLRSRREGLSNGGQSSGPVSFMKGFDAFAGVIKSGGTTRRAAKMVVLNVEHPDVVDFINCKVEDEKKAWALIDAGYDGSLDGPAYNTISYQNANNSVRVTDKFMQAVESDGEWQTKAVVTGETMETHRAKDIMRAMADAAWTCGDPGIQYDTTINNWHTCANTDRIHASNPCSEYMFLNDTACNLASINLMKFRRSDGSFDVASFRQAVQVFILAQEIIVDNAGYPTDRIAENSYRYRTLGLGYANLGALLMAQGLPYDDEIGRDYAAAITAIMTGESYRVSALIAEKKGVFAGYGENAEPMLKVIAQHQKAAQKLKEIDIDRNLAKMAQAVWAEAYDLGKKYGYRNAQVTVLAPTGTIAFMMDCTTTGVEPDLALVKYKKLVGGGMLKIVNETVPEALRKLGYPDNQVTEIIEYIDEQDTIEGAPHLKENHLPVFDCSFKPANGSRSIHYMGHIRMMAAVQPFISGAISKTVNMPSDATVEDVEDVYMQGWKIGIKSIAIYRDGCKRTQPLNTSKEDKKDDKAATAPRRQRLLDERQSVTHKFSVGGHEGYLTVGLYEDGRPGEIFITTAKGGSTLNGMMDAFALSISINLQYGVPLKVLVEKFSHMRFEPLGFTTNKDLPMAKSIMDYIFRWMENHFLKTEEKALEGGEGGGEAPEALEQNSSLPENNDKQLELDVALDRRNHFVFVNQADAPPCSDCGSITVRNGNCYKCMNCGISLGCS